MFNFYFGDSIPNWTDCIQALCAIIVVLLTMIMAFYARKAVKTWEKQKKFEVVTNGKSNVFICIELFEKLTDFAEIAYNGVPENESAAYKNEYKYFFLKDFKEHFSPNLLLAVVIYYDEFKKTHSSDRSRLIYEASRIVTYKDELSYLDEDLSLLKDFYSLALKKLNEFDSGFYNLKNELIDIDETKGLSLCTDIVEILLSFKETRTDELRSLQRSIFA